MTHKEARISKGFARQKCEAFADEFGMDGITTAEMALSSRRFVNKTTGESGEWFNARACLMRQFKK